MAVFFCVLLILLVIIVISKLSKNIKKKIPLSECQSLSIKVAGVTFNNDDGTSRQHYLKWFKKLDNPKITFKQYKYMGKPAIYVFCENRCIGNVPADQVSYVTDILDRIVKTICYIDCFNSRKGKVYFAELTIWYKKCG